MSVNWKKNLNRPETVVGLFAIAIAIIYIGSVKKPGNNPKPLPDTLNYQSLIKPEDQAPIPIAPESIKAGKILRLPVLMYHHIGVPPKDASPMRVGLTVSPENFAEQVKWLSDQGYTSVSLSQLQNYANGQTQGWPSKPIVFTFDDGYQDAFDNAIPVLKQYGYKGAFAIITQYPSQKQGDNFYAPWPQIAQAKQDGMEIVCHTQNHFDGSSPKFTAQNIYQNLSGCQADIKDHLGDAEPFLVYPYGHYTQTYLEQAKKAGFVMGFTIHSGLLLDMNNLMTLPRMRVSGGESMELFIKNLTMDNKTATSTKAALPK